MSDKQYYTAYILDSAGQILRYAFEYTIIEYWGEPESQAELKAYFKKNHYSRDEPISVGLSDYIDFMPYMGEPKSS
jgi:hypothetical protein